MLVVPVPDAQRLAAACALVGIDADVVPLPGRGSAVLPVQGPASSRAEDPAQRLSRVLGRVDVLALHHIDGQVSAQRWQRGAVRESPSPGLVMAGLPDRVRTAVLLVAVWTAVRLRRPRP